MFNCGLVLEGGGSRGIYTSGVLDAFMEKEIEFPYVIGVSMGSCNAASFIGKCRRRQHDIIVNYVNDKRYMSLESLRKNGEYLNCDWVFGELSYNIYPLDYDTFENSGTVFCCVAVNAKTGKAEYFYPKSLREWGCAEIRASCSLPGITKGTEIGGEIYYDGGLIDSIPLERAFQDGCQKAVVIQTQFSEYSKKPTSSKIEKLFKKYPKIGEAITNRYALYNNQLDFVKSNAGEGKAYLIQPLADLDCLPTEKSIAKLESIYQLGYTQGLEESDKVKKFING